MKTYYVYIVSNSNKVLYVGMTNNLLRRLYEHKIGMIDWFTKKYYCNILVWYETSSSVIDIITREKQIKGRNRKKKIVLIETINPNRKDLIKDFSTSLEMT